MSKSNSKVVFKDYTPNQMMLLPPSLEEMVPEGHPVRTVNHIMEKIDLDPLLKKFKGGGTSSYHPRMLLKVLVYGYLNNTYSSRKLEAALKENIHFMWLAGMNQPDHNTINRFRSDRLKDVLKEVFKQIVLLLAEAGLVDLKEAYLDGTKLEANANRYTFVWGKSLKTNKERVKKQLNELWDYAQKVATEELRDSNEKDFEEIDSDKVQQAIDRIDQALKDKPVEKKVKQKLNYARKHWPANLKKYEQQEQILNGRNSYSKTDQGATFMRMKDDHMKNGQLKPGYNWQLSTQNQVILNYTIHPNPTDTLTMIPHLEDFRKLYDQLPESLTADAGYGSQENYEYLENQEVEAFVKYNYFHLEQKKKPKHPFHKNHLHYNPEKDCYYCPIGQPMNKTGERQRTSENGFEQTYSIYRAQNCRGCPLRSSCHKGKGNRKIEVNQELERLKAKARAKLLSDKGLYHRSKRPVEVEAVFGNVKQNQNFKRFNLRGAQKVKIEAGLMAIAHNLKKMAA